MKKPLSSMSWVRSAHVEARLALSPFCWVGVVEGIIPPPSPTHQIGLRVSLHLRLDLQATLLRKLTLNLDLVSCMCVSS